MTVKRGKYLFRFVFSSSWDSRIVEKATDEEGGEHARGVDCHALKIIDTCTIGELQKQKIKTKPKSNQIIKVIIIIRINYQSLIITRNINNNDDDDNDDK